MNRPPVSRRGFLVSLLAATACTPAVTLPSISQPDGGPAALPTAISKLLLPEQAGAPEPAPLTLHADVEPSAVRQGGVARLLVRSTRTVEGAQGHLDGRAIPFDWEGNQAWAFAGFNSQAAPGSRTVTVTIVAAGDETASLTFPLDVVTTDFPVEHITIPPSPPTPPGTKPSQGAGLLTPSVLSQEWSRLLGVTGHVTAQRFWREPFVLPAQGRISSLYGSRRAYNGGPPEQPHQGMDFASPTGTPVVAANAGIARTGRWDVRGNIVLIDHGLGLWSGYYHLSEVLVGDGDPVQRGQLIGKIGATGMVTGPHLHWDMVLHGTHVDPQPWPKLTLPV